MSIQVQELTYDYTGMITQADYEEYIRFSGTDQDVILPTLIESAIRQAENYCHATFGDKTFAVQYDDVETGCSYYLPNPVIRSVTSVKTIAYDGTETALVEGSDYIVRGLNNKYITFLRTAYSNSGYPLIFQVEYSAGNEIPANVNLNVKEAILQILSENFENRMEGADVSINTLPRNSMVKLASFRTKII